ncbi:MAG: glycosyltransferase family 87 protein, partial [Acidobacteriota bacterium]
MHPVQPLVSAAWRLGAKLLILVGGLVLLWKGILPATGNARGDFANYYTASKLVAEGISIEPAYSDFAWFQRQMDRHGIQGQVGGWIPHPPPAALLFLPLTPLDPVAARTLWTLCNVVLVVLNVWLLARVSGLDWRLAAVLLLACGYGLLNNFLFGQIYLLLTASILGGLELARRGHPVAAGIVLGSLVPVKYFGGFFLLYFAWKRQWKLFWAGAASALAMAMASLAAVGWRAWESFLLQVLPRHLTGEIQDPYSVAFQSWNSLLRRLFLFEATLNPRPLAESPLAFFIFKSLLFWGLAALCLLIFIRMRFPSSEQQRLFELGWIPLVVLLLSPGSATYHFLLLSISAACWVGLAILQGRLGTVLLLAGLFAAVNLPHTVWLRPLAQGAWMPLAYSRLWLLTAFAAAAVLAFRAQLKGRVSVRGGAVAAVSILALLQASASYWSYRSRPADSAV